MRDHRVEERPSTPLELLFDLCFVVAVAFLAAELHHGVAEAHGWEAIGVYALLFVPVWWAWMSYTWYATAFSHDDGVTRMLTFAQMGGILAVAAAIPSAAEGHLVPFATAYALMRLPLILQWVRSGIVDPGHRGFAFTYAAGSIIAQVLWLAGALVGAVAGLVIFVIALGVELATPIAAVGRTPDRVFHPRHIAERYGLFTIIVLGETILAVSTGLSEVIEDGLLEADVLLAVFAALLLAAAVWWIYFATLSTDALERNRAAAFGWGYGHYVIFAAVAAMGAGIRAELDVVSGHGHPAIPSGAAVVAGAAALTLGALAALARVADPASRISHLVVAGVLLAGLAGLASTLGGLVTLLVGAGVVVVAVAVGTWRARTA